MMRISDGGVRFLVLHWFIERRVIHGVLVSISTNRERQMIPTKLTPSLLDAIRQQATKADTERSRFRPFQAPTWETVTVLLDHCTALEEERERLLNLVRYCRHELLDKDLITQEEFASLLGEGSAAKLETYDQLRAELKAAQEEARSAKREVARLRDERAGIRRPVY